MALLKCPDCGNMVSDRAPFCTKCGCPIDCIIKESKTINKEDNSLLHKSAKKNRTLQRTNPHRNGTVAREIRYRHRYWD